MKRSPSNSTATSLRSINAGSARAKAAASRSPSTGAVTRVRSSTSSRNGPVRAPCGVSTLMRPRTGVPAPAARAIHSMTGRESLSSARNPAASQPRVLSQLTIQSLKTNTSARAGAAKTRKEARGSRRASLEIGEGMGRGRVVEVARLPQASRGLATMAR